MHRYFLGAFIALCVMFWVMMAFGQEGPSAQMMAKACNLCSCRWWSVYGDAESN